MAMQGYTNNMELAVKNIKQKIPTMQDVIEDVQLTIEFLVSTEEYLEDEINDTFDQVVAMIEERRTCLLNHMYSRISSKREKLESQQKDLENTVEEGVSNCATVVRATENATSTQIRRVKKQLGESLERISNWTTPVVVETSHVTISWEGLEEMKKLASSVGEIVSSSCIPSLSSVVGEGLIKAVVGKQSLVTLTTRDCDGTITSGPILSEITCQIEAIGGREPGTFPHLIQGQVVFVKCGEYNIVYTLPDEGRYRMWINIYAQDIQDGPFQISCLPAEDTTISVKC